MRLIVAVFDALRTFDRPCSRSEIESATGLGRHEVRNGLDGLKHRRLVLVSGNPRERATYQLRPGAERPEDLRGRYTRTPAMRERIAHACSVRHRASAPHVVLAAPARPVHRPSMPTTHRAAPGAARASVPPVNDAAFVLQQLFRKR